MPPPTPNSEEPLNAPFGARCFLTEHGKVSKSLSKSVLMHLLALGAFWRDGIGCIDLDHCIVLMHLLALGAFWPKIIGVYWQDSKVLMHLLALGAFWPNERVCYLVSNYLVLMHLLALGAFWPGEGFSSTTKYGRS